MSTRAAIIRQADFGFQGIYLHSDGYPAWAGHILASYYADPESVRSLVELGDLSSLNRDGTADAYSRDRGEAYSSNAPRLAPLPGQMADLIGHDNQIYIFLDGTWYYNGVETPLQTVLADPTIHAEIQNLFPDPHSHSPS